MHYRKELSVLVIYIMIFSGLIGFIAIEPEEARAVRVLKVGGTGSGNYSSISSALQAASSGDTVFVYSGIYKETFTMKKNVDIIGEDVENTIIDAGDTWIAVSGANTAVIKGFTIKNFRSFGISIVSTIYLTVDNVIMICDSLKYDPGGINIENSKATILNSNIFAPNKASTGILTDKSTGNNVIVKNTIINGKFNQGFYVQAGASTSSYNNINLTYYPDRCWYGGAQKGTGDISKDPRFVNTNIDELNLSLKGSSPCIDAGDPADTVPDGGGDRVDIGAIEFKLDPMKLPGAPKDLEVSAADTKVKLKWSPPVKDGGSPVEYYRIYRGSSPDELELHNELENVTSYSDTTVTNDETYYYRMTALNTIGEGDSTGIVNVTPYEIIILDPPRIVYIETPKSVNRTESALIRIGVIFNGPISELLMSVLYKSPLDTTWKSDYLSTMEYVNGYWVCIFTPPKNARLGHFNFNFSASAYMDEYSYYPDLYQIEVMNNIPEEAEFTMWPKEPRTKDALRVVVLRIVDVETEPTKLILDYEWFKNGQSVPEYNGLSILPEAATKRGRHGAAP